MKKAINASSERVYKVVVTFSGFIGTETEYEVFAVDEEDACLRAEDMAIDDLSVDDVEEVDDGVYNVTVSFAGYIGADETYEVIADDEEEAAKLAFDEATMDLSGEVLDDDNDDEDFDDEDFDDEEGED